MCFAPQRRALFQHLNFQKCPKNGVLCTFWVGFLIAHLSRPAALASLHVNPPVPQIIGKTQCFTTLLPFRAPASSFFWLFIQRETPSLNGLFSRSDFPGSWATSSFGHYSDVTNWTISRTMIWSFWISPVYGLRRRALVYPYVARRPKFQRAQARAAFLLLPWLAVRVGSQLTNPW